MAPWGGTEPLLGTNPIAVAIPAGDEAPVVFDIATSVASNGAIRTHQLEGRPMPEGWVQNRKRRLADHRSEPDQRGHLSADGRLQGQRPLARHRAACRAAQPARRSAATSAISPRRPASELNVGQFVVALDVARFLPPEVFKAEVDRHIRDLASSQRLPGVDEIRVPGQGRVARRKEREAERRAALRGAGRPGRRGREVARRHRRSARAHERGRDAIAVARVAVLALLAALLSPAAGRRRLHRAAGGGRRRRQPAAVPALARDPQPGVLDRGGRRRSSIASAPGAT